MFLSHNLKSCVCRFVSLPPLSSIYFLLSNLFFSLSIFFSPSLYPPILLLSPIQEVVATLGAAGTATVVATHTATSAGVAKGAGAATNTVSQARLCHLQIMMYNYFENKIPKKTGLLRAIGPIVFCCGVEWKAL